VLFFWRLFPSEKPGSCQRLSQPKFLKPGQCTAHVQDESGRCTAFRVCFAGLHSPPQALTALAALRRSPPALARGILHYAPPSGRGTARHVCKMYRGTARHEKFSLSQSLTRIAIPDAGTRAPDRGRQGQGVVYQDGGREGQAGGRPVPRPWPTLRDRLLMG